MIDPDAFDFSDEPADRKGARTGLLLLLAFAVVEIALMAWWWL